MSKLRPEMVVLIRLLFAEGKASMRQLAYMFQVNRTTIRRIIQRRTHTDK